MHTARVLLKSVSAYSQSAAIQTSKGPNESHEDFDQRIWRERMHVTEDGYVYIPAMAFKNALAEAGKWLGKSIPGKGKSTYAKRLVAGVMVIEDLKLGIKAADVKSERLFVPSDGIRGSGKRVFRNFPLIPSWSGEVEFTILDDIITKDVFQEHLEQSGMFIGIGRFRPASNGTYGRFAVEKLTWM
jgi:hypothetical protein